MPRIVLLNPGPVNVSERVTAALTRGDLCHREEECTRLMADIRRKLVQVFDIAEDYSAVLITGSGTAALEMAVCSFVTPGKSLLVVDNGVYGKRIAKMADIHQIESQVLTIPWGDRPDLEAMEQALKSDANIEAVAMVHHETTTGLLNPLKEVGELAHRYGKKFLVDGISSLAGDPFDFAACHVDLAVGTANKCIQGIAGVAFALVRKDDLDRLEFIPARSLYLDLAGHHRTQEAGELLFTPAVQAHYALDEALDELLEETVAKRIDRTRQAAHLLREGFEQLGLEIMIPEAERSNVLTALKLPKGIDYPTLHDRLKGRGFVIYAGQGNLGNRIFRVANIGDIREAEFKRFLTALGESLA